MVQSQKSAKGARKGTCCHHRAVGNHRGYSVPSAVRLPWRLCSPVILCGNTSGLGLLPPLVDGSANVAMVDKVQKKDLTFRANLGIILSMTL